jgi:predicted DNA-binding transcriptional regulator YafY
MPKSANQKIKLLRLLEILRSDSDEENPLSTNEIIEMLAEQGIECGRKALYDDVRLLNAYGYEIMTVKSKQNNYYIADRTFDIAELRILLDTVQSAAFITKKKTKELVAKIAALAGSRKGELLWENTVFFDTVKHNNESVYYTVDTIDRAIESKKKIAFCYFNLDLDGKRIYRRAGERYIVNPVGLIFSDGFYYLVAYGDMRETLKNYRIDRMDKVQIEPDEVIPADCVKEFENYKVQNRAFGMFAGESAGVTLYVHNSLSEVIFDKFGLNTRLNKADDEHFTVCASVRLSPVFYSWCVMFGDKLKIISPKKVVDGLLKTVKTTQLLY